MMRQLGHPLLLDVIIRRMLDNGKANQKDVRLGVAERSDTRVTLLSCGIPQAEIGEKRNIGAHIQGII